MAVACPALLDPAARRFPKPLPGFGPDQGFDGVPVPSFP